MLFERSLIMKNFLLCSMFLTSAVCAQDFQAKQYTWQYVVQAKDAANLESLSEFNTKLREMIVEMNQDSVRSSGTEIYQKFLIFVKEIQEAIAAGANLFGSVAIAQEPLVVLVQEAAEQVLEQAIDAQVAEEVAANKNVAEEQVEAIVEEIEASVESLEEVIAQATPSVIPAIVITFNCKITDESKEEIWNTAVTAFQLLADKINSNQTTPDEVIASLVEIYNALSQLENAGLAFAGY